MYVIANSSFCDVWVWPVVIIAAVGFACAVLLRWAGIKRSGTAAGLAAGLLCGLTVLGKTFPDQYARFFTGGTTEHLSLKKIEEQHKADLLALTSTGVSPVALAELKGRQRKEIERAGEAYDRAVWNHGRGLRTIGLIFAGFVFGWIWPVGWKKPKIVMAGDSDPPGVNGGDSWSDAFFVHSWMFIIITGFVGAVMLLAFQRTRLESLAVGLTFALPSVGLLVTACQQTNENDDSDLPLRIAWIGWVIGLLVIIAALVMMRTVNSDSLLSYRTIHPGAVISAGLALTAGLILRLRWSTRGNSSSRGAGFIALMGTVVFVPIITAILCLKVDLTDSSVLWPVAVGMVVGGDGRWFAAASGMRVTGASWGKAMRRALNVADAGTLQVIIGLVLWMTGVITGPGMVAALVAAAVVSDVTVEKRRSLIIRWQDETKDEIETKR